jgi:hypothetical protein
VKPCVTTATRTFPHSLVKATTRGGLIMGTNARRIAMTIGVASLLGVAGVAGTVGGDSTTTVRATRSSSVHASADALERRALAATKAPVECDATDFAGSADAYERRSAGCVEPVVVFYGSPDSVERQAGT